MLFVIAKEEKKFLEISQSILFFKNLLKYYARYIKNILVEPAIMPTSQT